MNSHGLTKRLTKVEQAIPSKAKAEAHKSQWLVLFEEFGIPPDTPIPDEIPLGINFIKPEDRSIVSRMFPFNGKMLTAKQPEKVSGDYKQHDPSCSIGGQTTVP